MNSHLVLALGMGVLSIAIIAFVLVTVYRLTFRRWIVTTACPVDNENRELVVVESPGKPYGLDVVECGRPGETPASGKELTCDKTCRRYLPETLTRA